MKLRATLLIPNFVIDLTSRPYFHKIPKAETDIASVKDIQDGEFFLVLKNIKKQYVLLEFFSGYILKYSL